MIRKWSGKRMAAGAIALLAVLAPTVAVAQSGFGDVPPGFIHEEGINFVDENGITTGCGNGQNYCPNDPLTRGQMATFLHRISGTRPVRRPA